MNIKSRKSSKHNAGMSKLAAELNGMAVKAFDHAKWAYEDRGTVYVRRCAYHEQQTRQLADAIICERAHMAQCARHDADQAVAHAANNL